MKVTFTTDDAGTSDRLIAELWGDEKDPTGAVELTAFCQRMARDETLRRGLFNIDLARNTAQLAEEAVLGARFKEDYPRPSAAERPGPPR